MRTTHPFAVLLACAILSLAALAGARGSEPPSAESPNVQLRAPVRGLAAIRALGPSLERIARLNRLTPQALRQALLQNRDLWVDPAGRLTYACRPPSPEQLRRRAGAAGPAAAPPFPESDTFKLHSRPASRKKVYLDFDGHFTTGTAWNVLAGADIDSAPWDLDNSPATWGPEEHQDIQRTWLLVADDFSQFDIDVTTEDPGLEALRKTSTGDQDYGIRVVISPTSAWFPDAGGVAFLTSFNWASDTPCFVFADRLANVYKYIADASSHEVGHTLGLNHDGRIGGLEYYGGHAGWGPIMGAPYDQLLTHWSKGEYAGANNREDDLAVCAQFGGVTVGDDHGSSTGTATLVSGTQPTVKGIISSADDVDYIRFDTGQGLVRLSATAGYLVPAPSLANVDLQLDLLRHDGTVVAGTNPGGQNALHSLVLTPGTYYLRVDGAGLGDPLALGYTDYGSIGAYQIELQLHQPAPRGLAARALSSSRVAVSWIDNAEGETGFELERKEGSGAFSRIATLSGNATTYQDSGLKGETVYRYRVRSLVAAGPSPYSNEAEVTTLDSPPEAPDGLTAAASLGRVDLSWLDHSSNEDGFVVERKVGSGQFTELAAVGAGITTYVDLDVQAVTTYTYRVFAFNNGGESPASLEATASTPGNPPARPTGLSATIVNSGRIDLSWTDTSTNETGFKIDRKTGGSGGFVMVAQVSSGVTTASDLGLSANVAYTYRVRASNPSGNSDPSEEVSVTIPTPPLAPSRLTARAVSDTRINLSWRDASTNEEGFEIERKSGGADWSLLQTVPAGTRSYQDGAAAASTAYSYRVRARNGGGTSAYSNEAKATSAKAPAGKLSVPASITFSTTRIGRSSSRSLIIKNLSRTDSLQVTLTDPSAPFSIRGAARTFFIAKGRSKSVSLSFKPTAAGRVTGQLSITSSDPAKRTATVSLAGAGR